MANIVDHVDRISALSRSIHAAATPVSNSPIPGPFTHAVLQAPLGDIIRDIDPTEIGLFSLVHPSQPTIPEAEPGNIEITRVEFLGATPLRKPPSSRAGNAGGARGPREHGPEVYANAALKYLDRYQSIRPMPRAAEQAAQIVVRLEEVKASIHVLNQQLEQHPSSEPDEPPRSPKAAIKDEEQRISELQSQIQRLRKRKEELATKKLRAPLKSRRQSRGHAIEPPLDDGEASFWNTPGAAARTLHFTGDSLLDEEVDLANVSTTSFGTPTAVHKKAPLKLTPIHDAYPGQSSDQEDEDSEDEVLDELDGPVDPTVVLGAALEPQAQASPENPSEPEEPEDAVSPPAAQDDGPSNSATPHRQRIKVTTELERIVVRIRTTLFNVLLIFVSPHQQEKIWAAVGEVIMPGHPFDALGKSTSKGKPPRAKETMSYLRELSTHELSPSSPSASSFSSLSAPAGPSSVPTAQQVLTAHMLLILLESPSQSLTLRVLKENLSAKATSVGANSAAALIGGSAVTKPLYGCVAKRLLKIERGAGEQVVKFDL
ncbi:uncharacterized protein BXZ73DRAFT_88747 [Epithele typhae]|uniref:uncharacterized protein n=1 Tax=Epithele typhae TaxID=378194 RepID=UPI002008AEED|nr:uncharacterized protein BXZ73DRAFT_88747 [Epithele typhae]KAH9940528.1 hypothetical protein BXZ73DRAFT_88747 [Epithele typhae]